MFVDYIKIKVSAGKGGDGCVSFRREKYVPKGGPDGGNGGAGGDVVLEADVNCKSLSHLCCMSQFRAGNGQHGKGKNLCGKDGKRLIIKVPPGTLVYKEKSLLADLTSPGDSIIVAKGGKGGRGNAAFKTSTNQAPRTRELGSPGEKATLLLELKLIADIGLVGYPNAGKSTLLARISNATPKIANYPFTTLTPNLGTIRVGADDRLPLLTIADIPGIIEGAHRGKGLGIEFLRHIERTNMLIFVLDITQNPMNDYNTLINEIREYNPRILKKPSIIVLNKIDLLPDYQPISPLDSLKETIPISALKGNGIDKLLCILKEKLIQHFTEAT